VMQVIEVHDAASGKVLDTSPLLHQSAEYSVTLPSAGHYRCVSYHS